MEYIDIYDYMRQKTGRKCLRGEPVAEGEYYLVSQALVFNSRNELLIQQRAATKSGWPNLWDITAGGAVQAGEISQQTAERELWEEMGIRHVFQGTRPHVSATFSVGFTDVYMFREDIPLEAVHLQEEEVQNARWASREEVLALAAAGKFVNYYPSWINYLFDLADNRLEYGSFH